MNGDERLKRNLECVCKEGTEECCPKFTPRFLHLTEEKRKALGIEETLSHACLRMLLDAAETAARDRRMVRVIVAEEYTRALKRRLDLLVRSRLANIEDFAEDKMQLSEIHSLKEDLESLAAELKEGVIGE
jgi:hypothetical protein